MGQGQLLHSAGHGNIAQAPLLLHLLRLAHSAVAGEQTIFHAHHIHVGELQALGAVHGHHHHAVIAILCAVEVGIEGHFIEESRQRGIVGAIVEESVNRRGQFSHVLQASTALHVVLLRQHGHVSRAVADVFIKLHQLQLIGFLPHLLHHGYKAFQLYSRGFQLRIHRCVPQHLIEGDVILHRQVLGLIHGGSTDLAGGRVDNAAQAQIIGRVINEAEIGQHILHFGAVEELCAAHHLVGHAVAAESVFQSVGLGVHAIEDGMIPPVGTAIIVHHNIADDEVGLIALVESGLNDDLLALAAIRPQCFSLAALIVANNGVGGIQNMPRGAVVLLQTDGTSACILLFKVEDIINIRATETVDTLVIVAHHADVAVAACQQRGQAVLEMVGVLILVDQHIAELAAIVFPHFPIPLQQMHRL